MLNWDTTIFLWFCFSYVSVPGWLWKSERQAGTGGNGKALKWNGALDLSICDKLIYRVKICIAFIFGISEACASSLCFERRCFLLAIFVKAVSFFFLFLHSVYWCPVEMLIALWIQQMKFRMFERASTWIAWMLGVLIFTFSTIVTTIQYQ